MYKLNKSILTGEIDGVWQGDTFHPKDESNYGWRDYLKWVAEGNTPEPADE